MAGDPNSLRVETAGATLLTVRGALPMLIAGDRAGFEGIAGELTDNEWDAMRRVDFRAVAHLQTNLAYKRLGAADFLLPLSTRVAADLLGRRALADAVWWQPGCPDVLSDLRLTVVVQFWGFARSAADSEVAPEWFRDLARLEALLACARFGLPPTEFSGCQVPGGKRFGAGATLATFDCDVVALVRDLKVGVPAPEISPARRATYLAMWSTGSGARTAVMSERLYASLLRRDPRAELASDRMSSAVRTTVSDVARRVPGGPA